MKLYHHKVSLHQLLDRLIKHERFDQFHLLFERYHEADIAEGLSRLGLEKQHLFFTKVNPTLSVDALEELTLEQQVHLLLKFKTKLSANFIKEMNPNVAADVIDEISESDEKKAEDILGALPKKDAKTLQTLLEFEENSAGGIMTSEFLVIPENLMVKEALEAIKKQNPPDSEVSFYIFITDKKNILQGYLTLRDLLLSDHNTYIKDIRNEYPIYAYTTTDQEDIAKLFEKYDLIVLPIVNSEHELMGIITVDDVVDVVISEATEDLYRLSGTSEYNNEVFTSNILYSSLSRLPWLILTVLGGFVASILIKKYSEYYPSNAIPLAISLSFVPLIMGLSGNVGNQSATIIVRGLALRKMNEKKALYYIFKEVCIGFNISVVISVLVYFFSLYTNSFANLSLIVAISLLVNVTLGAFIGSGIPMILKAFNIDPAIASAPFISTTLDILGQLIYFILSIYLITYLL